MPLCNAPCGAFFIVNCNPVIALAEVDGPRAEMETLLAKVDGHRAEVEMLLAKVEGPPLAQDCLHSGLWPVLP